MDDNKEKRVKDLMESLFYLKSKESYYGSEFYNALKRLMNDSSEENQRQISKLYGVFHLADPNDKNTLKKIEKAVKDGETRDAVDIIVMKDNDDNSSDVLQMSK